MNKIVKQIMKELDKSGKLEVALYQKQIRNAVGWMASVGMVKVSESGDKLIVEKVS